MKKALLIISLLLGASTSIIATEITKTFRWSAAGDANNLDPHSVYDLNTLRLLDNTYEGLVRRDAALKIEPSLATKWVATNSTTWRFTLRQNVKFQDGTPFTANDVVFSFKRAKGKNSNMAGNIKTIVDVKKIDDYTVDLITNGSDPILPRTLASIYMMSEKWCKAHGSEEVSNLKEGQENFAATNAMGTGPFKITERKPDVKTVFEAYTDWWECCKHNIKTAVFTPISNDSTRTAAVLSGDVDVMFPVPIQDTQRIESTTSIDLVKGADLRTAFLIMNQKDDELKSSNVKGKNPFKDIRVRQAIYHAINIEAIHKRIMRGFSAPTALIYAPAVNGYSSALNKRLDYNLEKAKELMKQAGYEDGFSVTFDCPNDRYINDEKISQAIVSMLSKIGIKINLVSQTKSLFFGKILRYESDFLFLGWVPETGDAHNIFSSLVQTRDNEKQQALFNFGGYSNPTIDTLTDKIRSELNVTKRNQMIYDATKIMRDDVSHIPLHNQVVVWGKKKNIQVPLRPDDFFPLRDVVVN